MRKQGNLPITYEVNPRREGKTHCKAIILRSGKELETSVRVEKSIPKEQEEQVPLQLEEEVEEQMKSQLNSPQ